MQLVYDIKCFFSSLVAEARSVKTVSFAILMVVKRFMLYSTSLFNFWADTLSFSFKNLFSTSSLWTAQSDDISKMNESTFLSALAFAHSPDVGNFLRTP